MKIKNINRKVILILLISFLLFSCSKNEVKQTSTPSAEPTPIATESVPAETPMPDFDGLETILTDKIAGLDADWSLYFEDITSGRVISINSHQVYSASLIKLFVANAVYQKMSEGTLDDSDKVADNMYRMITYSDNDAWKALAQIIGNGSYTTGMEYVTNVAAANGFTETGHFMKGSRKNFNFTSVNDVGNYLHKLYYGDIVNNEYSTRILGLMKQQQVVHKIPSGIPDDVTVANKTGELEYMQGDAAIVFAPSGAYTLVIIGNEIDGGHTEVFTDLSSTIYNYLN